MKIPKKFSSQLPHTLEEDTIIFSVLDLSFVQNLPRG